MFPSHLAATFCGVVFSICLIDILLDRFFCLWNLDKYFNWKFPWKLKFGSAVTAAAFSVAPIRGVGLTPRDALTWSLGEVPSVHIPSSWPPARKPSYLTRSLMNWLPRSVRAPMQPNFTFKTHLASCLSYWFVWLGWCYVQSIISAPSLLMFPPES